MDQLTNLFMMQLHTSIEVLPQQCDNFIRDFDVTGAPRAQHRVFVTHLQGKPYQSVIDCCERLVDEGFQVAPHLAARNLVRTDKLEVIQERLNHLGISGMLLIAGDNQAPECYNSVQELLASNLIETIVTEWVYFAVFPDGHPYCSSDQQALEHIKHKCDWATTHQRKPCLISQISFSSRSVLRVQEQLHRNNIKVPLIPGCIGPVSIPRMIRLASTLQLRQVRSFATSTNLLKLVTAYKLESFIEPLAASGHIGGLHIFPFGNYVESLRVLGNLHTKYVQAQEYA